MVSQELDGNICEKFLRAASDEKFCDDGWISEVCFGGESLKFEAGRK